MACRARSAPVRDRHPAGGRAGVHVRRPAPAAGVRSAFDAGAGAAERGDIADLHRHRTQPGAGAVAVRHRGVSRRPARTALRRAYRCRTIRPTSAPSTCFDAGPAGYDAVFSLEPGAGDGMPQRTFAKPVEVQITGSILIYDLDDPLGGKGEPVKSLAGAIPGPAPLHPRRLCALCLHALRRPLCGVDPVSRQHRRARGVWPAARPTRSPSGF